MFLYSRNLHWTDGLKKKLAPVYKLMVGKFYIDEIYECLVIKPIYWISENLLWKTADAKLIDGLAVNGSAQVMGLAGRVVNFFQSGILSHYLLYLWIGLFVFLMVVFSS
ncbi:MAG: transmembrane NADH dehydrogenase I (chain L) oxidoreductase protein [uncultured bacterium]|nr:MAG: transmembrane NADH dehydrogenase I (chain L) oxidoreductase protein [uncultured bacterium]